MPRFWIRVNARLADDADVIAFAEALLPKLPTWQAVGLTCGLLVTFWGHVIDEQEDGNISARPDVAIERWAGWGGKRGHFATEFRARFTDETGAIRLWDEYQGVLIDRREKDRERKRAKTSAGIPQEVARSSDRNGNGNDQAPVSAPHGAERQEPAVDSGLAPAGAAPADVAAERTNGTGDYLDNPRTREEFIRRGLLRGDDVIPPAPDAAALLDSLAEQQRRDAAHFAAVKAAAWRWMRANPTDAKAMGAELRAALGLPLEQPVTGLRADTLEAEMIGAISARLQWPTADEWDGVTPIDSLTPLEPAPC